MKPDDIRFGCRYATSRTEYDYDPERWEQVINDRIRFTIADAIVKEKSEKLITNNLVEKKIDLYIASPEVFWDIVHKEAEMIALRFMKR